MNDGETLTKQRGTIIVDASFLFNLCSDIPSHNAQEEPKKFLEILPFLARNGYQIMIPELSSYEVGQILASGDDAGEAFVQDKRKVISDTIKPFLQDVALGKIPNISIVDNTGPREADEFCVELRKIAGKYPLLKSLNIFDSEEKAAKQTRGEMKDLIESRHSLIKHGDESVMSLVKKSLENGNKTPVFVFTDKGQTRDRVQSGYLPKEVSDVTSGQVVYDLVHNGIREEVGFPPKMGARELDKKRKQYFVNIGLDDHAVFGRHGDEPTYREIARLNPFNASMQELVQDIKRSKQVEQNSFPDGGGGNMVEKYGAPSSASLYK